MLLSLLHRTTTKGCAGNTEGPRRRQHAYICSSHQLEQPVRPLGVQAATGRIHEGIHAQCIRHPPREGKQVLRGIHALPRDVGLSEIAAVLPGGVRPHWPRNFGKFVARSHQKHRNLIIHLT